MPHVFRIRRGLEADLPALAVGEPAFTTDTDKFFIGTAHGNVLVSGFGNKGDKGDTGATGPQGEAGTSIVWRGAWSESTNYVALDVVTYGGSSWIAVEASLNRAPEEGVYWTILAEKGDTGADGADGVGIPTGGVNLALLAHSNQVSSNTDTDYSTVASASLFASSLRFKREAMKFFFVEKGNGNCQFVITDGTTTVTANGTNANSGSDVIGTVEADCSTLAYGVWWTVTVNSKAVSGAYEMRRINIMADPTSPMTGNTIMLSEPNCPVALQGQVRQEKAAEAVEHFQIRIGIGDDLA